MKDQETLRPKFFQGLELTEDLKTDKQIFAVGYYTGQMEKVFIGACRYCMFRPDPEDREELSEVINLLAGCFDLKVFCFYDENEYWVCKSSHASLFQDMMGAKFNSGEFHRLRAIMCGIDRRDIDPKYHEREGHKEHDKNG